jgi:RNA polymerase-binding transcription factor DksA
VKKRQTTRRTHKARAATKDILGVRETREAIPRKWSRYYRRLEQLLDDLRQQQADLNKDALEEKPTFSSHLADAGTDQYDRDFALGLLSSEQDAVYEIEEAMRRIRDGTYGVCELTGKRIEAKRLEAIPWTRFSAEAEKRLEKEGALRRAGLGPRTSVKVARESEPPEDAE